MTTHPGQPLPATSSSCTARAALARRPVLLVGVAIVAVTLLAAIASALVPELGPDGTPRPTLQGTPSDAVSIAWHNARTLALPLLLCAGRWHTARVTSWLGDVLVAAFVLVNAVLVGLALGRHPATLPAYLPHIPLEDGAVALAAGAWLARRRRPAGTDVPGLARTAGLVAVVTIAAAIVETYAVPRKG